MNESQKALSDLAVHNKYAKHLPGKNRRETWTEIVDRYLRMMIEKYGTHNDILTFDYLRGFQPSNMKEYDAVWNQYSPIAKEIVTNGTYIYNKSVLPSMRALQFAGIPAFRNNARVYNCAFMPIDNKASFSEAMFLLLSGTGVGYSVQFAHVAKLPEINKGTKSQKFVIGDSIEGWADAVKALMYWSFGERKTRPEFDFGDIRKKGELLITSGGKAPGPEPLRIALKKILAILDSKENGTKLTPLECHDIICIIADAVLAGGIRRAALISLFSMDDEEMLNSKSDVSVSMDIQKEGENFLNGIVTNNRGEKAEVFLSDTPLKKYHETGKVDWYWFYPYRGRANNSAVLVRHRVKREDFDKLWSNISKSTSGEPGIYFTNDANWGTNPCCEIALRPYQFCNLTEINAGSIKQVVDAKGLEYHTIKGYNKHLQYELNERARVAAFFGTLQAGFTDFHYLRPIWREITEKEALTGVGMTGIASGDTLDLDKYAASQVAVEENKRVASLIKINSAARVTTIKPSGTTSIVVGSSSGIHAWFAKYYLRSMQTAKDSDLAKYFFKNHPQLIKLMDLDPNSAVIGIPQMAPEGSVLREDENAIQFLDRVFNYYDTWVKPGHQSGANTNNVSATVFVDRNKLYDYDGVDLSTLVDDCDECGFNEWEVVGEYLWNNRDKFNGMSVLPYDGGSYVDAPFQVITEEEYHRKMQFVKDIDLTKIEELVDNTNLQDELACSGSNCDVK